MTDSVKTKKSNYLSIVFSLVAFGCAGILIYICLTFATTLPVLLGDSSAAQSRLVSMLDAFCQGNYAQASTCILGSPDFGIDREPGDKLGKIFWNAYRKSLSYELDGSLYVTDSGLAQNIRVTYLDYTSATESLPVRSKALLESHIAQSQDTAEVYDENNNYREDVISRILCEAAEEALEEDAKTVCIDLTVPLKYKDGQWWVIADRQLLDALFGGILS